MKNLPGSVTYPISIEESKPDAQQEAQYPSIKTLILTFFLTAALVQPHTLSSSKSKAYL